MDTNAAFINLNLAELFLEEFQLNIPYITPPNKTETVNNKPYSLTKEHKDARSPKQPTFNRNFGLHI